MAQSQGRPRRRHRLQRLFHDRCQTRTDGVLPRRDRAQREHRGGFLPVSYLLLAPAEWVGRALDWPIEQCLVLMRFANFAGAALIFAPIAWLVPRWRAAFMLVAFSPMLMMFRASVSADGMTAALALLFLSGLLRLWHQQRPPSAVQWALELGLGLLLCGCKPVYGLLIWCFLLLALRPDPARIGCVRAGSRCLQARRCSCSALRCPYI